MTVCCIKIFPLTYKNLSQKSQITFQPFSKTMTILRTQILRLLNLCIWSSKNTKLLMISMKSIPMTHPISHQDHVSSYKGYWGCDIVPVYLWAMAWWSKFISLQMSWSKCIIYLMVPDTYTWVSMCGFLELFKNYKNCVNVNTYII